MITAGGLTARLSSAVSAPSVSTSASWTILTTICPGVTERSTSWPTAFSVTCSTKSRATAAPRPPREGDAHFAHGGADVRLAERAAPAKPVEYAAEPVAQRCRTFNSPQRCRDPHMGSAKRKCAGGRNLVGRRAPVGAQHRCMSVKTPTALSALLRANQLALTCRHPGFPRFGGRTAMSSRLLLFAIVSMFAAAPLSAAPADEHAVARTIVSFVNAVNLDHEKDALAFFTSDASITEDLAPYHWQGPRAGAAGRGHGQQRRQNWNDGDHHALGQAAPHRGDGRPRLRSDPRA